MKPFKYLTNVEKAGMLHELFPQEIPALLEYTNKVAVILKGNVDMVRNHHLNGFLTANDWLSLAGEAQNKIDQYGKRLHTNSGLFADQLFDGHLAFYMMLCLNLYTTTRKHSNRKLVLAIDLLFNS